MVTQLIQTCLKLFRDGHDTGQLKLLNRAMKDMRYAYRVFNRYKGTRKIAIFGSARTPEDTLKMVGLTHTDILNTCLGLLQVQAV